MNTQFNREVNYWAHMLDESFGNESNTPTYTGKLIGYKWVIYATSNITDSQWMQTFDSEQAAFKAVYDEYFDPKVDDPDSWPWYGDNDDYGNELTSKDAFEYFKNNKHISSTDHTSYDTQIHLTKIKASDMQKLIDLVTIGHDDKLGYDFDFDGNNFKMDEMFEFGNNDEWDEFDKLTID